jgi:hypothetical protein
MRRSLRIVNVTLGLAGMGAAAGAVIALVAHTILLFMYLRPNHLARELALGFNPGVLGEVLLRGAVLGALVGPPAAWTLLRRVPIGWAVLGVAAGALVGGLGADQLLGEYFGHAPMPIRIVWLWGALAGVVPAALVLRRLFRPGAPSGSAVPAANEPVQLTEARAVAAAATAPVARVRT